MKEDIENQEKSKLITNKVTIPSLQDKELELDILATLSFDNKSQFKIELLSKDDFYNRETKEIFTSFFNMYKLKKIIDISLLGQEVKSKLVILSLFNRVMTILPSQLDLRIEKLKELANKRNLQEISYKATMMAQSEKDFKYIKDWQIRQLEDIKEVKDDIKTLYQLADESFEEKINSPKSVAIKTGYSKVDWYTGGFREGTLNIIASAQSIGKTSFIINIIRYLCRSLAKKVLFVDLETGEKQLYRKFISRITGLSFLEIEEMKKRDKEIWKELTLGELKTINKARAEQSTYKLYYLGGGLNTNDIKEEITKIGNVDIVFIDYLQLLDPVEKGKSIYEKMSNISKEIKLLARETNLPFVTVSSINRDYSDRRDFKPHISDIRDSGKLEFDADLVLLLHRPAAFKEYDEKDNISKFEYEHKMEIIVAKNRYGESNILIDMYFDGNRSLITETVEEIKGGK